MDIKYFEYVIGIVKCGSINKAAQNLRILQSNLGVHIKSLEQKLGSPALCRQYDGIRPTSEGELFLEFARKIATKLETIHSIPSILSHKDSLSISCTYSFDFMNHFLKFKKRKPPTIRENSLRETGLIQTIRGVVEQRYRISLSYCFDTVSNIYYVLTKKHNLKLIPIAHNRPLVLLASKKNPFSRKKEIPSGGIADHKFIMHENFKFDEWLEILNFKNNNSILYVFDRGGLIDTTYQSRCATVMMKRFTDTYSGDYVEISIVDFPLGMDAYCLYHTSYTMDSRERQFIWKLGELFTENPARWPI